MTLLSADSGAKFSPCRRWRYWLWRAWDESKPTLNLVGCNPSKAAEMTSDSTATKALTYAREWGFGRLEITNLYAYVATDPKAMKAAPFAVSDNFDLDANDRWLVARAKAADMVLCAWGMNGHFMGRAAHVEGLLRRARAGVPRSSKQGLHVLSLCKDGTPQHILYLPGNLTPFEWRS